MTEKTMEVRKTAVQPINSGAETHYSKLLMKLENSQKVRALARFRFSEYPVIEDHEVQSIKRDMEIINREFIPASPIEIANMVRRISVLPSRAVSQLSADQAKLMLADVVEALMDIPADLIEVARQRVMRNCRFFPSPVEIIDQVRKEIDERDNVRVTLTALLDKHHQNGL